MKIVDAIDTTAKVCELTGKEREDVFTKLVMGKDVTEEIKTGRGTFTVKYPKPKDLIDIGKLAAYRRGLTSPGVFDGTTENINIMASTLDVIVVGGPQWYDDAKKTNKNFSFAEVPSQEFINELFAKARSFRDEVDAHLKSSEDSSDTRIPSEQGTDETVGSGAFGGLSSE